MRSIIKVIYEGKIQGIGFCAFVLSLAKGYEITGWIHNLEDERIELLVAGENSEVDEFLQEIRESHLATHIQNEFIATAIEEKRLKGFRIIE